MSSALLRHSGLAAREAFEEADVLLPPTREDVWDTSVIEAIAASMPVVATAVAGMAAEIRLAGTCLVIENGSPTGVTDPLASLLEAPHRCREMGERDRRVAYRHGGAEQARVMNQIYAGVVEERVPGRRS